MATSLLKRTLLAALLGVLLGGCGGSDEHPPEAQATPAPTPAEAAHHEPQQPAPPHHAPKEELHAEAAHHEPQDEHHAEPAHHEPKGEHHAEPAHHEPKGEHHAEPAHHEPKGEHHAEPAHHEPKGEHHAEPAHHEPKGEHPSNGGHAAKDGGASGHGEKAADGHGDKAAEAAWEKLMAKVGGEVAEEKYTEAEASLEEAYKTASGDPKKTATCHRLKGQVLLAQGQVEEGVRLFKESIKLERSQEHPDYEAIAGSLSTIGGVHYSRREMKQAAIRLLEAADIMEEHSPMDFSKRRAALTNLAMVYASARKPKKVLMIKERLRLLAVEANEPCPEGALATGWLGRQPKPGCEPHAIRYATRYLPPDLGLAETRILSRKWPDPNAEAEGGGH